LNYTRAPPARYQPKLTSYGGGGSSGAANRINAETHANARGTLPPIRIVPRAVGVI